MNVGEGLRVEVERRFEYRVIYWISGLWRFGDFKDVRVKCLVALVLKCVNDSDLNW